MNATVQTTKPAVKTSAKTANKAVNKTPAKTQTAPTLLYAALLADALGGKYGAVLQRFYASAVNYHVKKQMTAFPRAFCAGQPLIPAKDVPDFFEKHKVSSIPSKLGVGNRLFDEMMIETAKLR